MVPAAFVFFAWIIPPAVMDASAGTGKTVVIKS